MKPSARISNLGRAAVGGGVSCEPSRYWSRPGMRMNEALTLPEDCEIRRGRSSKTASRSLINKEGASPATDFGTGRKSRAVNRKSSGFRR